MRARVQSFRTVGLGLAFGLLFVSGPTWSDIIKGAVKDPGVSRFSNGIAGVTLSVRDAKNTELAAGLTNGQGEYTVPYTGQKGGVKVIYEKVGFKPRPTVRWVLDVKSQHQKPVYLIREGAGDEYYKMAAATLGTSAATQLMNKPGSYSGDLQGMAMAVAALPANDKARVLQSLRSLPAGTALTAIEIAEMNEVITNRVKAALLDDPSLKSAEINVETFKGEVQLSGFVNSPVAKSRAVDVAREVQGVRSVKNDMRLNRGALAY